jgi:hypothetical protein
MSNNKKIKLHNVNLIFLDSKEQETSKNYKENKIRI